MPAKSKLDNIINIINDDKVSLKMYFITRHLKNGINKTAKMIDRFTFQANSIDTSSELNDFFIKTAKKQLEKAKSTDGYHLEEYSVITDDLNNKLYTYALNNALSFSDVITNQLLPGKTKTIDSLKSVKNNLWAYCLKLEGNSNTAFLFRKSSSGKIATDEAQTKLEKISSFFDLNDAELKITANETISFDDKLDCIYFNNEFLILRKAAFEQIVGLEEEFIQSAKDVISIIKDADLVVGIEQIENNLNTSRSLLKTLSSIGKKGNHTGFDKNELDKMKNVLKRFEGIELKTNPEGKLILENPNDAAYFIKLLNDYYKQGVITGKFYGTNSGQPIQAKP